MLFLASLSLTSYASETRNLIEQVYGAKALLRSCVFEWHRRFQEGRGSVQDDPQCHGNVVYCWKWGTCETMIAWKSPCYCEHIRKSEIEQGCTPADLTEQFRETETKCKNHPSQTDRWTETNHMKNCCWTFGRVRSDPTFVLSINAGWRWKLVLPVWPSNKATNGEVTVYLHLKK